MSVKAKGQITLSSVVDVKATYRYYLLQSSTLTKPSKPTAYPPASTWDDTEPTYTEGSTNSLYFVDCTVFCDDTFAYSEVSLSSSYEAAKAAYNKAVNAQNTASQAQQKVTSLSTEISETNSQITLLATKEEVAASVDDINSDMSDIENRLTAAEASIEVNADAIELRATKTEVGEAIDDIEVGGRNLLLNTAANSSGFAFNSAVECIGGVSGYTRLDETYNKCTIVKWNGSTTYDYSGPYFRLPNSSRASTDLIEGEVYTVSAWMKADTETSINQYNFPEGQNKIARSSTAIGTEWTRVWTTFKCTDAAKVTITMYTNRVADAESLCIYMCGLKLEKGNKATDWSPAPEDMYTKTQTDALIEVQSNKITASVTEIEGLKARTSSLELTSNSLTTRVTEAQSDIDNLEIGGRNLLLDSAAEITGNEYTLAILRTSSPPIANETYTISICVTPSSGVTSYYVYLSAGHAPLIQLSVTGTEKQILTGTFNAWYGSGKTPEDSRVYGDIYIYRLPNDGTVTENSTLHWAKLEKGNKATDWSPAPEDLASADDVSNAQNTADDAQSRVGEAEAIIQQLSDSISMLVTDGNGMSLMTQTESGWTFNTGAIQDALNSASKGVDDLTNSLGNTDSAVSALEEAVKDLGVFGEYIKIGVFEDEPCIELGEIDSDFKVLITNTRIMFRQGSSTPTYISNQTLITNKIDVKEELRQGNFVWTTRSNGNYGLMWKE